ncbi:MAG: hypothetical protein JSR34_00570 [Proteobacteria bacterium]|nr:hypothetical protein [Pseudomonadota bacterium]
MKTPLRLALAAACALSATACAAQSLVDLSIVDRDTGSTLTTYRHHGRSYVPGEPGHRYALHLYNHTSERVMVVLSVDGVNAVTGQTAAANQAGYVLGPWQSADIAGWRKSDDDIAQFVFTALGDSYAARTGRPDNVGVVGMAVFRERPQQPVYVPPPPMRPYADDEQRYSARAEGAPRNSAAAPAPATATNAQAAREAAPAAKAIGNIGGAVAQELGTGHGAREYSPISRTTFERLSSSPQQVTQIWYDSPQQLAARGIMPRWYPRPTQPAPQAFPVGYVPDPPPQW